MTDKHPKRPRDANQLAKSIVELATGENLPEALKKPRQTTNRDKGGAARARSLTATERKQIAKKAASARWKKNLPAREQTE
ncbi:MAG: histone H1 [Mesorhizobium sp.]|nr:MAG: histone H1 [Mesorhizobium sp.]